MKPVITDWTTVLVGSWNLAILNPGWAAAEIFQVETIQVDMAVGGMLSSLRYVHDDVIMTPTADRAIFSARHCTDEVLIKMEDLSVRLLTLLPRTPIAGVGINFGYLELEPKPELLEVLNARDSVKLADRNLIYTDASLTRAITYDDRTLNFKISQVDDGAVAFHFNFSHPAQNADEAIKALKDKIIPYRKAAEKILSDVYDLDVDWGEEDAEKE